MNYLTRREFLKISAISAGSLIISTGLSGCGNSDNDAVKVSFNHGVASGDPLSDKAIIWTRVTPDTSSVSVNRELVAVIPSISVNYEVATDKAFKNIIHNGNATTDSDQDYTVKVDVQNLDAASTYYYRFSSNGVTSVVGKMKTLPEDSIDKLKMAVFTCSNYPNGYFNAYMEASKIADLDVAVHLGDYIYEYGMYKNDDFKAKVPAYATKNAIKIGRELPKNNNKTCKTLEDYRNRYALYHTDAGLQVLHQAVPMIAIWDDHEVENNDYESGAEGSDETVENYDKRVKGALQAYFEWIPIRPTKNLKEIYRTFNFGDLVSLNMLETRVLARSKQLEYSDYFKQDGSFDKSNFVKDLTDTSRTMMGAKQIDWLQSEFAKSTAKWQVLGQQVVMGRMNLPSELLIYISQLESADAETQKTLLTKIKTSLSELAQLKMKALQGGSLTDEEKARLNTTLPYNLDAWDGYYTNREEIFATAKTLNKNLVVLSGDSHNSWANNLKDMHGNKVGVEFATTSVTSPGMEEYLNISTADEAKQLESVITLLIDDLNYSNLKDRGFMEVIFTPTEAISNWHYVSNYDSSTYTMNTSRKKSLKTTAGTNTIAEV